MQPNWIFNKFLLWSRKSLSFLLFLFPSFLPSFLPCTLPRFFFQILKISLRLTAFSWETSRLSRFPPAFFNFLTFSFCIWLPWTASTRTYYWKTGVRCFQVRNFFLCSSPSFSTSTHVQKPCDLISKNKNKFSFWFLLPLPYLKF